MTTRLYFHATTNALSNLPTVKQGSLTSNKDVDAQSVNRTMSTTIGTGQVSLNLSSNATTAAQKYYFGRFVTDTLSGISSITAQTWSYSFACFTNDARSNFPVGGVNLPVRITAYVWRPSTQTKVGDILDGNSASTVIEQTQATEASHNPSFSGSLVSGVVDGDVICFEVWFEIQQVVANSTSQRFYYDGTTVTLTENTTVSSHASFIETPQDLTFGPPLTRVSMSQTYKYSIATQVSLSQTYKYNIMGRVSLPQTYKYNIMGRVSLSRTYLYNIMVRVSQSRTYRYAIKSRVSLSRVYLYNIAARVSLSQTYRYSIGGPPREPTSHFRSLAATHGAPVILQPTAVERSLQESFSIGDSLEREKSQSRELEETVTLSDNLEDILKTHTCVMEDSFTTSDSLGRIATKFKTLATQTFSISEALSKARARSRTIAQSFTISDARSMARTRVRQITQFFDIDELLSKSLAKSRSFLSVESFSISDLAVAGKAKAKALAESFTIDDTMLGTIVARKFRAIAESFTISESLVRTKSRSLVAIPESFTTASSVAIAKVKGRLLTEAFTVTDALSRAIARGRSLAETFTITDAVARVKSRALAALAESFTITDALAEIKIKGKLLLESFSITDQLAKVKPTVRSLFETFTISEALTRVVTTFVKTWVLSGQSTDFLTRLDGMIIDYVTAQWQSTAPSLGTDQEVNVMIANHDYDKFRTYYIKVTEATAEIHNRQRANLYVFETPIEFECYARRLTKGEAFHDLNNIINELLRICLRYQAEDIFGVQGILYDGITSLDTVGNVSTDSAAKTVWRRVLRIRLVYYKANLLRGEQPTTGQMLPPEFTEFHGP